ncbi:MAG: hypothetical protein ACK4UN_17335, partial [Limisphaerales bacterium]
AALEPQHMAVLKKVLAERFVPFLPPLLGAANPEDQAAKQLSRAFSAFALHKRLNITPKDAAASVVDDNAAAVIDAVTIPGLISQPLDQLRQQTFDLGRQRLLGEGPLAYFRNQGNVASFMADLMETHFALTADTALPNLRNINTAADAYPRKRLLDYLSGKAPQL